MERKNKYCLGVIGGMGPMATAVFMEYVIKHTPAASDQGHLPMLIYHLPYIPDRTAYILDPAKENPLPYIIKAAKKLEADGATEIAIPCVTAHFFHSEMNRQLSVPLLDGVTETANHLTKNLCHRAGILATAGTVQAGLFTEAFAKCGIECIYPDAPHQEDVMSLIYKDIKKNCPVRKDVLDGILSHLDEKGADTIVLGCTELSLIPKEFFGCHTADVLEILAITCVKNAKD